MCSCAAEAVPAGQWVVGGGWNEMLWGGEVPTAAWLDEAAPANPVYLTRMDGHSAVVNSAALRAGGVDDETPDPDQGRILRDDAGAATGVLACAFSDQRASAHDARRSHCCCCPPLRYVIREHSSWRANNERHSSSDSPA